MQHVTVGAFGKPDSFSYLAAKWAYGKAVRSVPMTQDLFGEIRTGHLDIGVVPLENSSGGWVSDVLLELMHLTETDPNARIIREIELPVILCAATKHARMRLDSAARIYSHQYPLLYAKDWLRSQNPAAEQVATTSTSEAAERAAKDQHSVALCTERAARRHGLRVLFKTIPSDVENVTRFVSVSKRSMPHARPTKTSLWFSAEDKPGSLLRALAAFKKHGVNLTRIESRSLNSLDSYRFFVELQGAEHAPRVQRALADLRPRTLSMALLGSYPVDSVPKKAAARL